jgi:hypothetical protein
MARKGPCTVEVDKNDNQEVEHSRVGKILAEFLLLCRPDIDN